MHVVACHVRDELRIGESIRVAVLEVSDDRVRLGITSPFQNPEYQEQVIFVGGDGDGVGGEGDEVGGEGDESGTPWLQLAEV